MQAIPQPAAQSAVQKVSARQPQTTKDKSNSGAERFFLVAFLFLFCFVFSSSEFGESSEFSRSVKMTTGFSIRQFQWVNPFNVSISSAASFTSTLTTGYKTMRSFLSDFRPEVTPCSRQNVKIVLLLLPLGLSVNVCV